MRILVVDDERLVRWSLAQRLRADGMEVEEAGSVAEALQSTQPFDAAILDYRLPDGDGLAVMKALHERDPDLPVVMLTANKDVDTIVEAVKLGAADYVTKPFEIDDVELRLSRALNATRGRRELRRLKNDLARPFSLASIIGESEPMQRVRALASKISESPSSTVLITGESGTGKDLIAKVIHYGSSRANHPFLNITCSAMPETLLESELFGHERGAFTDARQQKRGLFEQGDDGTVFLDEVAETVPTFQAKLLRFLEERTFRRLGGTAEIRVDVRVIAATNRDLGKAITDGTFREDLFYRLNVLRLEMPALRTLGPDILRLAEYYVGRFSSEFRRSAMVISPEAATLLMAYRWPGNVRELRNLIERAVLLAGTDTLGVDDFASLRDSPPPASAGGDGIVLPEGGLNLESVERQLVVSALKRTGGNQTRAAELLGLHRDQVRYRIEKFKLDPSDPQ